jgi:ribonuclease P protein component
VGSVTVQAVVPAADGPRHEPPRAGAAVAYAIGRRIGSAVVRNRLRRRLRALVADHEGLRPDAAYLVTPGHEAVSRTAPALAADLRGALERATRSLR